MLTVEEFLGDPAASWRRSGNLRKVDWWEIVGSYRLTVNSEATKQALKDAVEHHLRGEGLLVAEEREGEEVVETTVDQAAQPPEEPRVGGAATPPGLTQSEALQLERLRLELQYRREEAALQRERERVAQEERQWLRETEHRKLEMAHELEVARMNSVATGQVRGDGNGLFYKARGLVPAFSEKEPEDFFSAFEQVAETLEWEEEKWVLLAQTVFPGKAQSAYLALGAEDRKDYEKVKGEVLKAYEVTPEHYRSRFRSARKSPGQRFAEFAHDLDRSLTKWWRALGADTLAKVREATLLEQFLKGVAPEVQIYLNERRVTTVKEAASLAEDFVLLSRQGREASGRSWRESGRPRQHSHEGNGAAGRATSRCLKCGSLNHVAWQCRASVMGDRGSGAIVRKCFMCGKAGHLSPSCPQRGGGKHSGHSACVTAFQNDSKEHDYKEYIREGFLVIGEERKTRMPVRILRDSGAKCNLVLRNLVPRLVGKGMMAMKGVGGVVNSPLVEACLEAEGKRLRAVLAVVDELPIPGVEVLLGNGSGGKMRIESFLGEAAEEVGESGVHFQTREATEVSGELNGRAMRALQSDSGVERTAGEAMGLATKPLQEEFLEGVGDLFSLPQAQEECRKVEATAAVTRAQARQHAQQEESLEDVGGFFSHPQVEVEARRERDGTEAGADGGERSGDEDEEEQVEARAAVESGSGEGALPLSRGDLIRAQRADPDLAQLWDGAISREEAEGRTSCYYTEGGVLKRRWSPSKPYEDHQDRSQVVVPSAYRRRLVQMAHEETAAHLGIRKTGDALLTYFYWRGLRRDVAKYVGSCHLCQITGNKKPVRAPLQPIPMVTEPFEKVVVDVVGPLPRSSAGNEFLLTLMCTATRYADAIPISSCRARKIVPRLIEVFSKFGMPKVIQTDRGTNFMGKFFKKVLNSMGVAHITSTAYHPQSQGCLERWHGTLKGILTKFCLKNQRDWDEGVQVALYAIRTAKHEGLGYSPFELMFGRKPRENLRLLREGWEAEVEPQPLAEYITNLRERMRCAQELARSNLEAAQGKMKAQYDKGTKCREFEKGDRVLLFDNTACRPLQAKYRGPFVVLERKGPVNYLLSTPGRKQASRTVHVNLLKPYRGEVEAAAAVGVDVEELPDEVVSQRGEQDFSHSMAGPRLANSQARAEIGARLGHLEEGQRKQLMRVLDEYALIMQDTPSRTPLLQHDVVLVEGAKPVRQYPYRLSPEKKRLMRKEVQYLLDNGMAGPSKSPWASPCVLVGKEDGTPRLCTDYRKLNQATVEDPYPMKRIDDLVDEVSAAKFLTSVDLLKGFWQVGLTDRAREASAFVTPDGHYEYRVMPFGMRNSSATFQSLTDQLVSGLEGVTAYVDDLLVHSNTWEEHVRRLRALFSRLAEAKLTINLAKCEFGASTVKYLGHRVGHGGIRPLEAKVADIVSFEAPKNKRALRSFLGLIGFYRRFCPNFAQVASPLTDLLSERSSWKWSSACEEAFKNLKALLTSTPILQAPDFKKEFVLFVDASDRGIGGMLGQEYDGIVKPVAYMSKKLLRHQKGYSVVEKEAFGLMKCLEKFEVYLDGKVTVYSDHNPLKFVESMKLKNARLARWALSLQGRNLEIRHVPGKQNVVADALSRPN